MSTVLKIIKETEKTQNILKAFFLEIFFIYIW